MRCANYRANWFKLSDQLICAIEVTKGKVVMLKLQKEKSMQIKFKNPWELRDDTYKFNDSKLDPHIVPWLVHLDKPTLH